MKIDFRDYEHCPICGRKTESNDYYIGEGRNLLCDMPVDCETEYYNGFHFSVAPDDISFCTKNAAIEIQENGYWELWSLPVVGDPVASGYNADELFDLNDIPSILKSMDTIALYG